MALFVLFLGGEGKNSPIFSHFFPLFLNEIFERKKCVSFFLPKTHFFLRLFFLVKITPQKNVRLKIAFLDTHRAQTSSSSSVHASSANPSRTTFLRRRETTTTQKKSPTAGARSGRFCGVRFRAKKSVLSFLKTFFVRFFPRERERERERDLEKDLSDRAKNDAAR